MLYNITLQIAVSIFVFCYHMCMCIIDFYSRFLNNVIMFITGNNGITSFALQLISECAPKRLVFKIVVSLPPTYPDKLPDVCIHSTDLTRQQQAHLHAALMSYLHEQMGEPMLLEMALWLQDNAVTYCEDPEPPSQRSLTDTSADHQLTLLHLDHMRARTQYIKTIERWTSELGLSGRLVFLDSLILLLLEGRPQAIKVELGCNSWVW